MYIPRIHLILSRYNFFRVHINQYFTFILDGISGSNPRVIDDIRARKLAADLKRCSYYETCATYGLHVERVFQDGKLNQCSTNLKILTTDFD